MTTIGFSIRTLQIPMRVSFKHASAERSVTESLWVEARRGPHVGLGEGCPRSYVTGETPEGALLWAQTQVENLKNKIDTLDDLKKYLAQYKDEIDKNLSAWCAVELAILDLLAKEKNVSLEKLLGVSEEKTRFQYSAVLSADDEVKFEKNLKKYLSYGFSDFKLKVMDDGSQDFERLKVLASYVTPERRLCWPPIRILASAYARRSPTNFRLRLDANNVWAGRAAELKSFVDRLPLKVWAIEEPFAPQDYESMSQLSLEKNIGIILDESLCKTEDIDSASAYPARWIANLRVSKLGGLLRGLEVIKKLKNKNWEMIVGAQVGETSVLSRAALVLARAAGSQLVAQEGAFGTLLLEHDMAHPMVKFGLAGIVRNGSDRELGLGLTKDRV
jgi:L-alanine-DL-glutamate epimerase-like enolase superfamily enzyme